MRQAGQDKDSQLDCDILFLRYEIEKRLRAVYVWTKAVDFACDPHRFDDKEVVK